MDPSNLFQIKIFRIGKEVDDQYLNNKSNPIVQYKNKQHILTESFGQAYVGYDLAVIGKINIKGNTSLEYLNVTFTVYLEGNKDVIYQSKKEFKQQPLNSMSDLTIPAEFKLETQDNYIFSYHLYFKQQSFIQNQQNQYQFSDQDWKKKFRITPSLPFAIELPRLCPWLSPSYFLEYPFCNQSDETITIKEIDFRAEDPFEVVKIQIPSKNGNNGEMILKKGEKENVIFKIQVKPNQQQIFNDILKSLQKQQEKTVNLGSIFLQWGQFGVMVGQTVPLKIVSPDLALEIIDENIVQDPNSENHIWKKREFYLEQVQKIRVKVYSPTQKDMELKIHLQEKDMENIKVLGYDKQFIKLDIENPSQEIIFIIMPINAGIFQIKGIHLINTLNNQSVFFKNQLHIRAQSNDLGIQEIQSEQQCVDLI